MYTSTQSLTRALAIALSAVTLAATPADAEVVGIYTPSWYVPAPVPTSWGWVWFVELYARSNSPTDNIVGVTDASIFMTGSVPTWYNASPGPGQPIAGAAPLTGIDLTAQPQMNGDSFVTIGNYQEAAENTTALEPNFDDALFLTDGSIGESTGWYNSDPSNGQGLVGSIVPGLFGHVLLGRFSIIFPEQPYAGEIPKLHISSLTITYTTGLFGTELKTWTLPFPYSAPYYIPVPGAVLPLLAAGLLRRRRRCRGVWQRRVISS